MNMDFTIKSANESKAFHIGNSTETNASTRCDLVETIDALLQAASESAADFQFDVLIDFNNGRGEMLYLSIRKDYRNKVFVMCKPLAIGSTSPVRTLASADECKKAALDLFDLCSRQTNVKILK